MNAQCTHSPHTHTITDTTSRGFRQCAFSLLFASVKKNLSRQLHEREQRRDEQSDHPDGPGRDVHLVLGFQRESFFRFGPGKASVGTVTCMRKQSGGFEPPRSGVIGPDTVRM
jgi:hypothetical protein